MTSADKVRQIAAVPTDDSVDPSIERPGDRADFPERHGYESTLLDPHDDPTRRLGSRRQILLAPPLPNSDRAQGPSDPLIIHRLGV